MDDGDRERAHFSRGKIFFRVCLKLSSQAKIDGAHGVESWVWGPHGHKDLSTERMYCSTLRLWIGLWLATRTPVQTL